MKYKLLYCITYSVEVLESGICQWDWDPMGFVSRDLELGLRLLERFELRQIWLRKFRENIRDSPILTFGTTWKKSEIQGQSHRTRGLSSLKNLTVPNLSHGTIIPGIVWAGANILGTDNFYESPYYEFSQEKNWSKGDDL